MLTFSSERGVCIFPEQNSLVTNPSHESRDMLRERRAFRTPFSAVSLLVFRLEEGIGILTPKSL